MKTLLYPILLVAFLLSACGTTSTNTPRPPTKIPPTKTPLPSPTPTQTPRPVSLNACVTDSTIRIRRGPGKEYEVIGGLVSGTCMSILGRNQDSSWVYMTSEDDKNGWVAASLLTIDGDLKQVSVHSESEVLSIAPATKVPPTPRPLPTSTHQPTATRKPIILVTNTRPAISAPFVMSCSQTANSIGDSVTCEIKQAYCEYFPTVDGSPTFCNDRPYPNHNFTLVVFGEDWSDYDGECIIVSGYVSLYRGLPQIQAFSRSQVSYCE